MGIDPGSNATGFCFIDHDADTNLNNVIYEETLTAREALFMNPLLEEHIGSKPARLRGYAEHFRTLLELFEPDVVVCESPFMHMRPQAFRVLAELTALFEQQTSYWNYFVEFRFVSPSVVKKNMGVKGNSNDKDEMKIALAKKADLSYAPNVVLEHMTEHSVDSVCVGLWFSSTALEG